MHDEGDFTDVILNPWILISILLFLFAYSKCLINISVHCLLICLEPHSENNEAYDFCSPEVNGEKPFFNEVESV